MAYWECYRTDDYVLCLVVNDRDYVEYVMKYNRVSKYKNIILIIKIDDGYVFL